MPNWNNSTDWQNTVPGAGSGPMIGNFVGDNNAGSPIACENYGASLSASAETNTAAIQAALAVGGEVTLSTTGTYNVTALPTVSSSANLTLGTGVTLTDGSQSQTGAKRSVLTDASAGQSSAWFPYVPGMRLAYALSSGSAATGFTVDIASQPPTSLAQAFTGTWSSSTAYEISPPIYLTNATARFLRFNVVSGGPINVDSYV